MLRAFRTWLTGRRRLNYLLAERVFHEAKAAHEDAYARKDTRAKHETGRRLRDARTALMRAEIAMRSRRSPRLRSERTTNGGVLFQ